MKHIKLFENFNESYYKEEYNKYASKEELDNFFDNVEVFADDSYKVKIPFIFTTEEKIEIIETCIREIDDSEENIKKWIEESKRESDIYKRMLEEDYSDSDFGEEQIDKLLKAYKQLYDEKLKDYNNAKKRLEEFDYKEDFKPILNWHRNSRGGVAMEIMIKRSEEESRKKELTKEDYIDYFITALEGGSNYWYALIDLHKDISYNVKHNKKSLSEAIGEHIFNGGSVNFYDKDNITGKDKDEIGAMIKNQENLLGTVDMDSLLGTITIIKRDYPEIWDGFLIGQYDAADADVFLQLCVMEEVVYG